MWLPLQGYSFGHVSNRQYTLAKKIIKQSLYGDENGTFCGIIPRLFERHFLLNYVIEFFY